jgi:hypothetical protein
VGSLTNRDQVFLTPLQSQVIPGSLSTGAVGTAFLGPSPDGTCRAVFSVVTADGAIVQEHTAKGLDGIAPAGTVKPLLRQSWRPPNQKTEPRLGVLMNPYTFTPDAAWQLFVSERFNNTIAVINLQISGSSPNQVFGLKSVNRISSPSLNLPVDLAPVQRDVDSVKWASNTTLDDGSDFYVANRGNNTIVRMGQDGSVMEVRGDSKSPGLWPRRSRVPSIRPREDIRRRCGRCFASLAYFWRSPLSARDSCRIVRIIR